MCPAVQRPQGSTNRVAATYFNPTEYTIGLNLTDGKMHRVALYCLDWDGNNARARSWCEYFIRES